MTDVFDPRRFVNDFVRAMNSKDPKPFVRHYADDAELSDPTLASPVRGRAAIEKSVEQWSRSFSQVEFNVKDVVASGNKIAIRIGATARHTGPIDAGPGEGIAPTGRTVKMEVAEFLTLDAQGKVSRDETIFDLAGMFSQIKR